jgi:DMSO reductase anchor subunit
LLLIGLGVPLALLPANAGFGLAVLATAVALATGGLVSSVFHLGRPERAWRAFSRWRSSWLSREGVMSVATFVPAAVFAIGWIFFGGTSGIIGLCGILAAALAAGTIYCTGMIYASWRSRPASGW